MWLFLLCSLLSATVATSILCGSDRKEVKKPENSKRRSQKSSRSGKSNNRKSSRSGRSSRSSRKSYRSRQLKSSGTTKGKSRRSGSGESTETTKTITKKSSVKSAKVKTNGNVAELEKKKKSAAVEPSLPARTQQPSVPQVVDLHVEPAEITLPSIGGLQSFKFVNGSPDRRLFKVKCSDNLLYRVAPVFGLVEPHGSVSIDLLRMNGSVKVDKLVLLTAKIDEPVGRKTPKELMAAISPLHYQMTIVPLIVDP